MYHDLIRVTSFVFPAAPYYYTLTLYIDLDPPTPTAAMGKRKKTHEFEDQYGGGAKPQDVEQFGFSKGVRHTAAAAGEVTGDRRWHVSGGCGG